MKILLISPLHREKEYYSKKRNTDFMPFQGQQSWIDALVNLGHEVKVFKGNYTSKWYANLIFIIQRISPKLYLKLMNAKNRFYKYDPFSLIKSSSLKSVANVFNPKLIILSGGLTEIKPIILKEIKNRNNSKLILMSGVNPFTSATSLEKELIRERVIDLVVENDTGYAKKWKKLGVRKSLVLPISSANPQLYKRLKLSNSDFGKYKCDVCFIGSLTIDRQKLLTSILGFDIKIWGDIPPGVSLEKKIKNYYKGRAFDNESVKIYNSSKIVINFQPKDMNEGGNMRTFEIPACQAFQLTNKINKKWFRDGKELVLFTDVDDLKHKIRYYLQNDYKRIKIAKAGYNRVLKEHTYEKHFKKLIS